jgi:hypothetical protein
MTTPASPSRYYGTIDPHQACTSSPSHEDEEWVPLIVAFDPQDEYPDATNDQKDVLKLMDANIREMRKGDLLVKVPPLETSQVIAMRYPMHPSLRTSYTVCRSWFGRTFISFFVSIVVCVATWYYFDTFRVDKVLTEQEYLQFVLPALVAVVATWGASGPLRHRLWGFAREVAFWNQPRKVKNAISETVEEQVLLEVATAIDNIHLRLTMVLDEISSKAQAIQSPKDRKRYLKADLTLPEIPIDPDQVEQELLGAKSELQASVMHFLQDITVENVKDWVPERLRDAQMYYDRARNETLWVLFLLQFAFSYGMYWGLALYFPTAEEDYAEPFVELGEVQADNIAESTGLMVAMEDYVTSKVLTWSLALSLEAYILSSIYVNVVFELKTAAAQTARLCTAFRETVLTVKTREALQQSGIQFLCRDILEFRMLKTKQQLLKLISFGNRIDRIVEAIDGDITSVTTASTGFSLSSYSPLAPLSGSTIRTQENRLREGGDLSTRWQSTFASWKRKPTLENKSSATRKGLGASSTHVQQKQ